MLQLLRKYQKTVFAVVAVFVIASFAFFGTQRAMTPMRVAQPDYVIGKAIDGSEMKSQEIKQLIKLLNSSSAEVDINLLNDRVIERDLFASGLGLILMTEYQMQIENDLKARFERVQRYQPYVHPEKVISAEGVWKMFIPGVLEDLSRIKSSEDPSSKEYLSSLISLYLQQVDFPASMLRRFLKYQEQQYSKWISPDPYLNGGDLGLFHAKTLSDWFGPKFLEIAAQFIHNSALFAKEKGYSVSYEEARSALLQVGLRKLQEADQNRQVAVEDLSRAFQRQLSHLNMTEKEATLAWQKILLFRKLFQDVGCSLFVDSLTTKNLYDEASQKLSLDLYTLSHAIQVSDKEDAIKLELYLEAISEARENGNLPKKVLSVERLKEKDSPLLQKRFLVEVTSVDKQQIAADIALKEMYAWQVEEKNWQKLGEKFQKLTSLQETDSEKRFTFLSNLDDKLRREIDQFSRMQMVDEGPNLIREYLVKEESDYHVLKFANKETKEILPGIKNNEALLALLEKTAEGNDLKHASLVEELSCFTQDREHYYSIKLIDASPSWELLTFAEAKKFSALSEMFEDRLKAAYQKSKVAKSFDKAKEDLVELLFSEYVEKSGLSGHEEKEKLYFSIFQYLQTMKQRAEKGDDAIFAKKEPVEFEDQSLAKRLSLENQFKLKKEHLDLGYEDPHPLKELSFAEMGDGEWSNISYVSSHGLCFLQLKKREKDQEYVAKKMREERYLLGKEAKMSLMKQLIREINANDALHIASTESNGS